MKQPGTWNGQPVTFRIAKPDQADQVLDILDEAAAWLHARGVSQWPRRFERSWIDAALRRDETWLVEVGNTTAATVTLNLSDPVWTGFGDDAGYLHRMTVRRGVAGLGAVILDWAENTVRQHHRTALRLDCIASNDRLRAYYEAAGFAHRGDVPVLGAPGQRRHEGPATLISRYELVLKPADDLARCRSQTP